MDDKFIPEENISEKTENEISLEETSVDNKTDVFEKPENTSFESGNTADAKIITPQPAVNNNYQPINPAQPFNPVNSIGSASPENTAPAITPNIQGAPENNNGKKKKKGSAGKVIFILLICIAVIVSSVLVITNDNIKDYLKNPDKPTEESQLHDDNVVSPSLEDTPSLDSEYSGEGPMTPEQVYTAVKDINVGVLVYSKNEMISEGSGIVYSKDSTDTYTYIVTAAHVVDGKNVEVLIQFNDGTEADAQIIGCDTKTDVAVLRIEGADYKTATIGNSDNLSVGQSVYAIGNPGGVEFFGSFTGGMISAIDRPVPSTSTTYDLPCIQHTAAINPGNSGGALVNEYGQVIGLNSSKISSTEYEGMGFAVPSKTVNEVYVELVKNGYVSNRPKLGIQYFPVSSDRSYLEVAWRNDLPFGSVVIDSISEDSDLYTKDVKAGDVITAVNGVDLETTDILLEAIEDSKVNDTIKLTIYRFNNNGTINKTFDVTVKLVEDKGQASSEGSTEQETQHYVDPYEYFFGD